jgi:hypothetical protein
VDAEQLVRQKWHLLKATMKETMESSELGNPRGTTS